MKIILILLIMQQSNIPEELLAARQNRSSAVKGLISWRSVTKQSTESYTTKFAGGEWINRGSIFGGGLVITQLHRNGEYWTTFDDSSMHCNILLAPHRSLFDARTIGFSPDGALQTLDFVISDPLSWFTGISDKTYTVSDDGPYKLITTQLVSEKGRRKGTIKQWLDPDKDLNVVKSQRFTARGLVSESITTLQKDNQGHWFPSVTVVYRGGDRTEPYTTLIVDEVVFDDEGLPDRLGPEDINVEIGTNIHKEGAFGPNEHANRHVTHSWDGENLVGFDEMAARVNNGELKLGPNILEIMSKARTRNVVKKRFNQQVKKKYENSDVHTKLAQLITKRSSDEFFRIWELYILRFIGFYDLSADQQSKALSIYKSVREIGESYVARKLNDFEKLDKRIDTLVSLPETKNKQKMVDELANEGMKLTAPLIDLFNKQLKPRLFSLLTRKQKERGEVK